VSRDTVHVRYMVDDVEAADRLLYTHFGFELLTNQAPAFADVSEESPPAAQRAGELGPRARCLTVEQPLPGGWNASTFWSKILRAKWSACGRPGLVFRNDIVKGPGGAQVLVDDPAAIQSSSSSQVSPEKGDE
jgi:hypothetical protein